MPTLEAPAPPSGVRLRAPTGRLTHVSFRRQRRVQGRFAHHSLVLHPKSSACCSIRFPPTPRGPAAPHHLDYDPDSGEFSQLDGDPLSRIDGRVPGAAKGTPASIGSKLALRGVILAEMAIPLQLAHD